MSAGLSRLSDLPLPKGNNDIAATYYRMRADSNRNIAPAHGQRLGIEPSLTKKDSIMQTLRKAACVSSILLSACAPNCPPPKVVTQIVKEPVAVACIAPAIIPPEPGSVALPIDARLAADIAASQAKDLRKWGRSLMALIGPCTIDRAAIER